MKKSLFILLTIAFIASGQLFAQSIVSANPNTVNAGNSITMVVTGTNTNFMAATGAYIYKAGPGGAFYNATNFTPSSATVMSVDYSLPPNAPIGNYTVGVYGPSELPNGLSVAIGPGSAYGEISGYVNYDYNNNCIIDPGENGLANRVVAINNQYVSTNANGYYSAWVPFGNYTVTTSTPPFHFLTCPAPSTITVNTSLGQYANNSFYLDTINVSDLVVYVSAGIMRPGFSFWANVTVQNIGNTPNSPTTGYFVTQNNLFSAITYNTATSTNGDTAFFNVPTIAPGSSMSFGASGTVSTSTTLGTTIYFHSEVVPALSEANLLNNSAATSRTVVGSYDPNDKQVWDLDGNIADGYIDPTDSVLRYLVRFQNTGTDTAFNIYIRDTLDANLDVSTLTIEQASHNWNMSITDTGSVQWTFPNILLLDSFSNEPLSHGYIGYSIKLKPGLPIGTQIDNTAHIYFDFNAPVVTNTVSSIICPEIMPSYTFAGAGNTVNYSGSATTAVTAWLWDFGDGNTSTAQNPSHTYANGGFYTVCLYTTNSCGRTDSTCQSVGVNCAAPTSAFSSTSANSTATFTDLSTGGATSWLWDFGDGNTSTMASPTHTYASPGTYTVCLIATSVCGSDTSCQSVTVSCTAPVSAFNANVASSTVTFTDQSTGSPSSWFWTFGDGGNSTQQNPSHTYAMAGTYNVCLISTNGCDSDTTCQTVTVICVAPTAAYTSSVSGATASFNDLSTGNPAGWYWTFGDGGTSILQNPSHTYSSAGTFNVCLIATSVCGSDTSCNTVTTACATPVVSFNVSQVGATVSLSDQSSNAPTSWMWTFGDGSSSTLQNPSHSYTSSGNYIVCLVASNACGSDTNCINLSVVVGLEESLFNRFDLYPNPTQTNFVVDMELREESLVSFRLYNVVGAVLRHEPEALLKGEVRKSFDLNELPSGMYLLEMQVNGRSMTWKVVKD